MANYCFKGQVFQGHDLKIPKGSDIQSYPSVTTIIGLLDKSAALIPWAQRMTISYIQDHWAECKSLEGHALSNFFELAQKESTRTKEDAASYGTDLHKLLEQAIKGEAITSEARDDVEFYCAIDGIVKRSKAWRTEIPVVHEQACFAGSADLYDAESHTLYDLKTSKRVYDAHYMQIAAYKMALETMGYQVDKAVILHWDKEDLVLNEIDCTAKALAKQDAFLLLCDFYYAEKKRRVKNAKTQGESALGKCAVPEKIGA